MINAALTETASIQSGAVRVPHYIHVRGKNYMEINGRIWRMYRYTAGSALTKAEGCRSVGYAFGSFTAMISGCEYSAVTEEIHDYQRRLSRLAELSANGGVHSSMLSLFTDTGEELSRVFNDSLPRRNVHNDAKSDNVIFGDICTVIDLDTVGEGYAALDFGDMVRSLCKSEPDMELLVPLTQGYAYGLGGILSAGEVRSLAAGIFYVTAELAMRYIIDAASGDGYFHRSAADCMARADELIGQLELFSRNRSFITETINKSFAE